MEKVEYKFKNGQEVIDLVSGVKGIINAQSSWLNGCIRYSVQPKAKQDDNSMPESWWIDEEQLKLLGEGVSIKSKRTGGPSEKAPRF